jgi:hypothetical protein
MHRHDELKYYCREHAPKADLWLRDVPVADFVGHMVRVGFPERGMDHREYIGIAFTCPQGHTFEVGYDRDELTRTIAEQHVHDVWCDVCRRVYTPTVECLETTRTMLEVGWRQEQA